ncbi:MAG TPA: molybdate ABC transporter substrate-binding protein [Solirubrobacteraceae bacterium]|nr:molybdate ABC transporter substrate-binding protein [Solirubrobacteraceae bacterium]
MTSLKPHRGLCMHIQDARRSATALAAAAALAAGCGSTSTAATTTSASRPIVLAAASLTKVFPMIDPNAKFSFGGSGALAAEIEQGAPDDVYAAASPKDPTALYAKGLIDRPVPFATNTLVLVVPESNPAHITSVSDITKTGVKIVICNATVPCGDYARTAFTNLGITTAAMKNVVSQATDVTQVVADVASGAADAGFVYITDADAAKGKVKVVRLPAKAKPGTVDEIAIEKKAPDPSGAKAFVVAVLSAQGQATLRDAGFGPPPKK